MAEVCKKKTLQKNQGQTKIILLKVRKYLVNGYFSRKLAVSGSSFLFFEQPYLVDFKVDYSYICSLSFPGAVLAMTACDSRD